MPPPPTPAPFPDQERPFSWTRKWVWFRLDRTHGWSRVDKERVGREVAPCSEYPYSCCTSVTQLMLPLSRDPILVVDCDMHEKSKMTNKYCFKMLSVWHQRGVCVCVYPRCLCLSVPVWTCMYICVHACVHVCVHGDFKHTPTTLMHPQKCLF